jgi:hypothetical protein
MAKKMRSLFAILLTGSFSATVYAEDVPMVRLLQVQGNVMVNDGVKYQKVTSGMQVKLGTKIVTAKDATVDLVYPNGCIKTVKSNTLIAVGSNDECAAALFKNEKTYVTVAAGDKTLPDTQKKGFWQQLTPGKWAFIGLGGAAIAYGISEATDGDNDSITVVSPAAPL